MLCRQHGFAEEQGKYTDAEPFLRRALETFERTLGRDHPNTLISAKIIRFLLQAKDKARAEQAAAKAAEELQRGEAEALFRAEQAAAKAADELLLLLDEEEESGKKKASGKKKESGKKGKGKQR